MSIEYNSVCLGTQVPQWAIEIPNTIPCHPQHSTNEYALSRIFKNNWADLNVAHWIKLIDQKKIIDIDFQEFISILNTSNLSSTEITQIKECRKKAQRAKSSLKCHANKRHREIEQIKEIKVLLTIRNELELEKDELLRDINLYKQEVLKCC